MSGCQLNVYESCHKRCEKLLKTAPSGLEALEQRKSIQISWLHAVSLGNFEDLMKCIVYRVQYIHQRTVSVDLIIS